MVSVRECMVIHLSDFGEEGVVSAFGEGVAVSPFG